MANAMPVGQGEITTSGARLVWVLNDDVHPYTATFQGIKITIPARMEKIPKRVEQGGNLMPYLAAVKFIRDYKQPQGFHEDEMGGKHPIFGKKALMEMELTDTERDNIAGGKFDAQKAAAADERRVRKNLSKELDKVSNKILLEDE